MDLVQTEILPKDILSSGDNLAVEEMMAKKISQNMSCAKSNFDLVNSLNKNKCENLKESKKEVTKIPRSTAIVKGPKLELKEKSEKTKINQITLLSTKSEKNSIKNNTTDYKLLSMDFQKRKSRSQMDFQHCRNISCTRNLVPVNHNGLSSTNFMCNNEMEQSYRGAKNDFFYFSNNCNENEIDSKIAGMRILSSIMVNAWRKRRDDVKRLSEELNIMKKNNIKVKNQIHVLNSLFKIEQKQNDDLNKRLKKSQDDQQKFQDKYQHLICAFDKSQEEKVAANKKLQLQKEENEGLSLMLKQTKSQLQEIGQTEKTLKELFEYERSKIIDLENVKNELLQKINDLEGIIQSKQNEYGNEIKSKEEVISNYKSELDILENKLNELKNTEAQLRDFRNTNICQQQIINDLTHEVNRLQDEFNNTFVKRFKTIFNIFPSKTFHYLHVFSFYLLPAIPTPLNFDLNRLNLKFKNE